MVNITIYGGAGEIGGNKILVEDKGTRIFLDFGQSFGLLDEYFVDWLQPRDRFGLRDLFALGLMPKVKGLYNKNALERTDLAYYEPEFHGVFISHPHFDHTAHLRHLDPSIPVYMGETCKTILDSVQETTNAFFFSEERVEKKNGTVIEANKMNVFRTGKKLKIDNLEITPIHVDHSVPGAYGFLVETSEGVLAYTGDLRRHGNKPEMTEHFIEKAKKAEPEILIIEGTRVSKGEKRKNHTEQLVYQESMKLAKNTEKLMLAMRYPKDLDRFRSFYEIAKKTGKTIIISMKTAHMLLSLKDDKPLNLPDPTKDDNIEVYCREMKTYKTWEKPIMEHCIDAEWVKKNQKSLIWELDFAQLQELIDIKPESGGVCIHSMSEPFEEDPISQLQDEILHNWTNRFGMRYEQYHASGHASKEEIFEMIGEIRPKSLIPVHTQEPELFRETKAKALLPENGKKIEL